MAAHSIKLCYFGKRKLLSLMGILVAMIVFHQFWAFPSGSYFSALSPGQEQGPSLTVRVRSSSHSEYSPLKDGSTFNLVKDLDGVASRMNVEDKDEGVTSDNEKLVNDVGFHKDLSSMMKFRSSKNNGSTQGVTTKGILDQMPMDDRVEALGIGLNVSASISGSPVTEIKQAVELEAGSSSEGGESSLRNESLKIERYLRRMRGRTISLSEMKPQLFSSPVSSTLMKRRWSAARDRELLSARSQIENAPVLRGFTELHAPFFRNISVFKRSYDLMERVLKIYVYKEGEKPIFHQPRVRGIYSAEGWFMKLIERSKRFRVRDPKKAHLFYLPFSAETLRSTLHEENSHGIKNLERYLTDYVDLIKKKYRFWNRTGGADHFFVACHDWAPRITRQNMNNCIRALCNANAARGFSIGKDVSVPVTFVRSGNDPLRDIGGKPPLEREILAFFAGRIHGYLRPLLLQYWENKAPDMKIFGPMKRDIEGKASYREFMKSSKYCICARGYGVHTPRVVESIFYECVPVIISDNYVPPFFEVLDWEAFAVFVQEKDIPNLRNILVSIPDDRYLVMQMRVKMVQRHFVWHKLPEKYDLFHMILHSVWFNRLSQIR